MNNELISNSSIIKSIISLISRNYVLIIMIVALATLSAILHHKLNPSFKANARLHIQSPEDSPLMSSMARISGNPAQRYSDTDYADKYIKILYSNGFNQFLYRNILKNIPSVRKLLPNLKFKNKKNLAELASEQLTVSSQFRKSDYDIITVSAWSKKPKQAVAIANYMSKVATLAIVEFEQLEIQEAYKYLLSEDMKTYQRITSLNKSLEEFKKKEIVNHQATAESSINKLQEELELANVKVEQNNLLAHQIKTRAQSIISANPQLRNVASVNGNFMNHRGKLLDTINYLKEQNQTLQAHIKALSNRLQILYSKRTPKYEQKIYELNKQLELEHTFYQSIKKQIFDSSVQKIAIKNRVRAYDPASSKQVSAQIPLSKKVLFVIISSFSIVIIFLYMWEQLHPVILSRTELAELGMFYLGHIPKILKGKDKALGISRYINKTKYPTHSKFDSEAAMAFRYLRTRILQSFALKDGGKVISVISPTANDGKSVVSSNIALSFSHLRKRVLVVDADFRKASLDEVFNVGSNVGIFDYFSRKIPLSDIIQTTKFKNLDFVSSGTYSENQPDAINSENIKDLLDELKLHYDVIVIDTPAFQVSPEALLITEHADIPLLVSKYGKTQSNDLAELVEILHYHNVESIYSVINEFSTGISGSTNLYYVNSKKMQQRSAANDDF